MLMKCADLKRGFRGTAKTMMPLGDVLREYVVDYAGIQTSENLSTNVIAVSLPTLAVLADVE